MGRRNDVDARDAVSIFNLSFLDVFACALGALVLILLMIFNQVTLTFDTKTVKEKIEAIEAKKQKVVGSVLQNNEAEKAAQEWDAVKNSVQSKIALLEQQLKDYQASVQANVNITTDALVQMRQSVNQLQAQLQMQKQSINNVWFGTGAVHQKARFIEVYSDYLLDHGDGKSARIDSGNVVSFISKLATIQGQEYPLFIIRPEGIGLWEALEIAIEDMSIIYGFEPYTAVWDPILKSGGMP